MADISSVTLLDGTSYSLKDSTARQQIGAINPTYVVKGTQSTSTGGWTGNIPVESLSDGTTILYYLPYDGNGNATLNLTFSDLSISGPIDVYYNGDTRMTTQYPAGSMIQLTYWSSGSINVNGTATNSARWVGYAPTIALEWGDLDN